MVSKKPARKQSGIIGYLLIGLFGAPFAVIGLLVDFQVLQVGVNDLRIQFWKETPCTILSTELAAREGEDGLLYGVKATYRYIENGNEHLGTRVSLLQQFDNQKAFHQGIHKLLEEHRVAGKPFRCYVNPSDPSDSVLFRDSPIWTIAMMTWMGLVFTAIGLGLLSVTVISWIEQRRVPKVSTGPPWRQRADWAAGEIRHSDRQTSSVLIYSALAVFVIASTGTLIGVRELLRGGNPRAAVGLLPMAVGAIILKAGVSRWIRWQRYGDSIFQLASTPGLVGGSLAGIVRTEKSVDSEEGFRAILTCTETSRSNVDDDDSTSKVLWEEEQTIVKVVPLTESDGIAIPVAFVIPYEQPSSNDDSQYDTISWRLSVNSLSPGANYRSEFEVPVFQTERSRRNYQPEKTTMAEYAAPADSMAWLKSAKLTSEPLSDAGYRILFPCRRNIGFAICMALLQLIFSLVSVAICYHFWHTGWPFVAALFSYGLLSSAIDLLFFRSEVDVLPNGITVRSGSITMRADRQLDAGSIKKFVTKFAGSAGNDSAVDLYAELKDGKLVLLGKRIIPSRVADALVKHLSKELALS